jgi:hypothetical protein
MRKPVGCRRAHLYHQVKTTRLIAAIIVMSAGILLLVAVWLRQLDIVRLDHDEVRGQPDLAALLVDVRVLGKADVDVDTGELRLEYETGAADADIFKAMLRNSLRSEGWVEQAALSSELRFEHATRGMRVDVGYRQFPYVTVRRHRVPSAPESRSSGR